MQIWQLCCWGQPFFCLYKAVWTGIPSCVTIVLSDGFSLKHWFPNVTQMYDSLQLYHQIESDFISHRLSLSEECLSVNPFTLPSFLPGHRKWVFPHAALSSHRKQEVTSHAWGKMTNQNSGCFKDEYDGMCWATCTLYLSNGSLVRVALCFRSVHHLQMN